MNNRVNVGVLYPGRYEGYMGFWELWMGLSFNFELTLWKDLVYQLPVHSSILICNLIFIHHLGYL